MRSGHGNLALGYANLGEVLLKKGNTVQAKAYLNKAHDMCEDGRGPGYLLPDVCRAVAELELVEGRCEAARLMAERALRLAEAAGDRPREARSLKVLGEIFSVVGDHGAAEASLEKAADIFGQLDQVTLLAEVETLRSKLGRLEEDSSDGTA